MNPSLQEAPVAAAPAVASVDGVALHALDEALDAQALRQRACTELLRRAAIRAGLLDADDPLPERGAISVAASDAIEALLERELRVNEPSDEACERHYQAHAGRYVDGEQVRLRHVLFAVTPGVDVRALRRRAETCLLEVRSRRDDEADPFANAAATLSNCPSGQQGGELGWLASADCAPEFAREIFGHSEVGVLPRLVHSRFGLHVVEVLERTPGVQRSLGEVRAAVAQSLRQQSMATALRQYLQLLAADAIIEGVDLDAANSPLVQ